MPSTTVPTTFTREQEKIIMDTSALTTASDLTKEDSDTILLCDIDQDLTDSDDDYDSDEDDDSEASSDEEMEAQLEAAENLLRGLEKKRSLRSVNSFGSAASVGSMGGSSIGSVSALFGQPPEMIENHMMKKSVKHMHDNSMASCASVADLQELLLQHQSPKSGLDGKKDRQLPTRRNSGSFLEVGHIGQEASAQKIEIDDGAINPDEHLAQLLGGSPQKFTFDSLDGFFLPSSPEYLHAWTNELTRVVREQDLAALKTMHQQGQLLQACNNFGETIIHLTVRRGTPEMLRFLLQDAQVSMRVCCDLGRTPLHDAAWCLASNPKSYQMMALLLNESPMLVLIKDNRGHTPLSYVPRAKWAECNAFLDRQYAKGRFASLSMK